MIEPNNINFVTNTLKGFCRDRNQDDILIIHNENFSLFVLFDGVSSYVDSIDYIYACKLYIKENYEKYLLRKFGLRDLFFDMHNQLMDSEFEGKSTCSALLIYPDYKKGYILNLGDSRIYSFSNTYLEPLTKDDNLPGNNRILLKYLGKKELTLDDFIQTPINIESNFLLCSDGFYSLMEMSLNKYFPILHYKRKGNIIKAINQLQFGINKDDSMSFS
jgi:serine/threonine protein phosphatase PrpC